ncbi:hypothetical protein [Sideroxydans sp. CL21]|uniref:hypothetical protein n=1 Tax=Sideroxydans sp. CL21 TaxID=2600596 RepID=UPI0024BCDA74|nr:hypothetical protein [Sideroxydans sp. CL21]
MKNLIALTCLLLASFATPSFAHESTNDCDKQAATITDTAKRAEFMKSCLKKVDEEKSYEQDLHDKRQHCDTNAENMKLEGKKKEEYLNHCYKENDFDKSNPHPKM